MGGRVIQSFRSIDGGDFLIRRWGSHQSPKADNGLVWPTVAIGARLRLPGSGPGQYCIEFEFQVLDLLKKNDRLQ